MLICTKNEKETKQTVTVFDTSTGIRYLLVLTDGNAHPVDVYVDSMHGVEGENACFMKFSDEEACEFWGQLKNHEYAMISNKVTDFLDLTYKNACDVLKIRKKS